jgi:hypothetical protein
MPDTRPSTRVAFVVLAAAAAAFSVLLTAFAAVAVAIALLVPSGRRGERRWLRAPATAEVR